jgi:hypothetical protein
MLAKIKDNVVVVFPYGYDDLQAENPHTRFTGNLDLMELFPQTEEALLRGHELVRVGVEEKPVIHSFEEATLADLPTLENGNWVLKWGVSFRQFTGD